MDQCQAYHRLAKAFRLPLPTTLALQGFPGWAYPAQAQGVPSMATSPKGSFLTSTGNTCWEQSPCSGCSVWPWFCCARSTPSPLAQHVAGGWKGFSPPTFLSCFQEPLGSALIFLRASAG